MNRVRDSTKKSRVHTSGAQPIPRPADEEARLSALYKYQLLDTAPEPDFDFLAEMAAEVCSAPYAFISLVDTNRVWYKSSCGLAATEFARDGDYCSWAILEDELLHVPDLTRDARTANMPLTTGVPYYRMYCGANLVTDAGQHVGMLCVLDTRPRQLSGAQQTMLIRLARLVVALMELRLRDRELRTALEATHQLANQLLQSNRELSVREEQYRDLFDEAPIAYLHEGHDARFIRANRVAMKILGITPEEVSGMNGKSFVPDTPEAQQRLSQVLETMGRGTETNGIVLELRRKDNGEPVWIQWWSRPVRGESFTRTMFIDITDRVLMEQERAKLKAQNDYFYEEILSEYNFGAIIGKSPGLRKVMQQTQLVAPTHSTVLISGESGTGKELVARAIHEQSLRKSRVLIKVNCSAVADGLFESEFFGHVRGAFTGAIKDKLGRFELADGGTLFLDEISEVPLSMQAKLLRVLQEQELERVGDSHTRKIDVRVIAATNRDLEKEVAAGRFRQDLFYRLSIFPIHLPPLRERRDDIPLLAAHFARTIAQQMNRPALQLTRTAMIQLAAYDWPGNIRELQNAIERAVILSKGGPLHFEFTESKPGRVQGVDNPTLAKPTFLTREDLKRQERDNIVRALKRTQGKVFGPGGAAELLGMKPTTLASRIRTMQITQELWNAQISHEAPTPDRRRRRDGGRDE